jgi:MoxR-like ATPase
MRRASFCVRGRGVRRRGIARHERHGFALRVKPLSVRKGEKHRRKAGGFAPCAARRPVLYRPRQKPHFSELMPQKNLPTSIDETLTLLSSAGYIADRSLATVLFLSLKMGRPIFLEGEAGVGKTEIGKVLAETLGRKLIRLQCYEGLDVASAVYEWNYAAQMVEIRLAEAAGDVDRETLSKDIFTDRFLIKRPILQALEPDIAGPPILLIDELDRADEAFEAFLLEVLADNQVTVPEVGTIRAEHPPIVVVTTNRTREIHDALKRRCFYHWVDYPDAARELEIVTTRVPGIRERLAAEVVGFVQKLREEDLFKRPGVAETIDWASALTELDQIALDPATVNDTLGVLLKYQDDIARVEQSRTKAMLDEVRAELAAAE